MAHNRVHIDGYLASGGERWSTSFAFAALDGTALADSTQLTAWANGIMTSFGSGVGWAGALRTLISAQGGIDRIRTYYYPGVGQAATAAGSSTVAGVAGSGTATMPLQSSLVFSLITGLPGGSFRGRSYWPFINGVMTTGGKIATTITLNTRATDFATMLDTIADLVTGPPTLRPVIVSVSKLAVTPVTTVRVGDVVDTQRRRTQQLVESFGSAAIP